MDFGKNQWELPISHEEILFSHNKLYQINFSSFQWLWNEMTPEIIFVFAWPCKAGGACSLVTHKSERQRRQAWNNGKKLFLKEKSSVFMVLYFLLQFIWIRRSPTHYSLLPREAMWYKITNSYWPRQWNFLIIWVQAPYLSALDFWHYPVWNFKFVTILFQK